MRNLSIRSLIVGSTIVATVFLMTPLPAASQAAARTRASTVPRTPQGRPDFSGIWQVMNSANWDIQDHHAQKGMPAGQGVVEGNEIPYQPWALAKKKDNYENRKTADPETKCYLPGVPRITYTPFPFQIVQMPASVAIHKRVAFHNVQDIAVVVSCPVKPCPVVKMDDIDNQGIGIPPAP